jgi:hypothetical protein
MHKLKVSASVQPPFLNLNTTTVKITPYPFIIKGMIVIRMCIYHGCVSC